MILVTIDCWSDDRSSAGAVAVAVGCRAAQVTSADPIVTQAAHPDLPARLVGEAVRPSVQHPWSRTSPKGVSAKKVIDNAQIRSTELALELGIPSDVFEAENSGSPLKLRSMAKPTTLATSWRT
jgi:hypothetical protein